MHITESKSKASLKNHAKVLKTSRYSK